MQELKALETSVLMDMLATHTAFYTKMLNDGLTGDEEYLKCKLTIQALQLEIEARKQTNANTSISDPNIKLPE
jgi:hypothetical protein